MSLMRINHNPSRRQLNFFGLLWLVFGGVVGGLVLIRGGPMASAGAVWALAAVVAVTGWFVPRLMRIVFLGMAYAASPIGLVVSFLVLLIVYYLVLSPIGLLMRWFGHDPMNRRFDQDAETYWCRHKREDGPSGYFRQF
jgi:hypothetical protein